MKAHLVYGFVAAERQGSAVLIANRLITVAASGECRLGEAVSVEERFYSKT